MPTLSFALFGLSGEVVVVLLNSLPVSFSIQWLLPRRSAEDEPDYFVEEELDVAHCLQFVLIRSYAWYVQEVKLVSQAERHVTSTV
jgi:hypothetical protein